MKPAIIAVAALSLCACAGPSKDQYRKLLAECRMQNREHIRLLNAWENQSVAGPEQKLGSAEVGMGGF